MPKLAPTLLALFAALPARADAPKAFIALRDRAEPVETLTTFLDRYVGHCNDPFEKAACLANARRDRTQMTDHSYYAILGESACRMLRAGAYNPASRELRLDLTPFFEAGDFALTDGAPIGLDGEGRPRIALLPMTSSLPSGWLPMDMERLLRSGQVRVHLIFKPLGLWSLPDRSGGKLEGVRSKFLAVRLVNARTGEEIALHVAR